MTMLDFYSFSHLDKESGILNAVSTKNTNAPYDFSLALHTGEAHADILHNRLQLSQHFGRVSYHYIVAQQTHSDHIHIVTQQHTQGWREECTAIADCDALITSQRNVVLTILTADCVPILLYDPVQKVIAIVHAGWKGTAAKIAAKTVTKMATHFGSDASNILAGIGPAIGKCCYEVGEDVAKYFSEYPYGYSQKKSKYMLDLPHINETQLCHVGVLKSNIVRSGICTACNVARFFSYRKEQGCSGRFMSMIVLNADLR